MKAIITLLFFVVGYVGTYSTKDLKCSVCKVVIQEMEKEIAKVNPNKKINLGHRINDKGKVVDKTKPFARSEIHLSELMDSICEKMDDYVRAKNKTSGKIEIIPLITEAGVMNPDFSKYEIVQDSDLNKSLKFYCDSILDEYDTEVVNVLQREIKNPDVKFCTEEAGLCDDTPNHNEL